MSWNLRVCCCSVVETYDLMIIFLAISCPIVEINLHGVTVSYA